MNIKISKLIFILMVLSSSIVAQSLRIGGGGGLNMFQGSNHFTDRLYFKDEPTYGAKIKFSLPLLPLRITGQAYYTSMKGNGTLDGPENTQVELDNSASLFTVSVGTELSLVPGPLSPYVGFDIMMNSFSEVTMDVKGPANTVVISRFNNNEGFTRFGLGLGAGMEFTLLPIMDLDISAKYNFNNLIGKEQNEDNLNTVQITANLLFRVL